MRRPVIAWQRSQSAPVHRHPRIRRTRDDRRSPPPARFRASSRRSVKTAPRESSDRGRFAARLPDTCASVERKGAVLAKSIGENRQTVLCNPRDHVGHHPIDILGWFPKLGGQDVSAQIRRDDIVAFFRERREHAESLHLGRFVQPVTGFRLDRSGAVRMETPRERSAPVASSPPRTPPAWLSQ